MAAEDNLRTAYQASARTIVMLIVFLCVTPLIIRGWKPTVYHFFFLPALLVCFGIILWARKKKLKGRAAYAVCFLYMFVVILFLFLIDTVGAPETPACFLPVAYVGLFPLFILPLWFSCGLVFILEILFVILVVLLKPVSVGQYDIFISLVGVGCSMAVIRLTVRLRTQAYHNQVKYKQMSEMDVISRVYNKRSGMAAASRYIETNNPRTICALLVLDLDCFKKVNDVRGHRAGDVVLGCVGDILLQEFRNTDIIVRFGGDEYMVLVKGAASKEMVERKVKNIERALVSQTEEKIHMPVSCSVGAVLAKDKNVDFSKLFQQADTALYQAKALEGQGQAVILEYGEDSL